MMEFLCKMKSSTLSFTLIPHLRALACSARCIPRIPSTRPIYTGRPRPVTFPTSPPAALRRFERTISPAPSTSATSTTAGTPTITSRSKPNTKKPSSSETLPRRPTNRQIPFSHVFVLDPDTNKLSQTKRSLESLLLETSEQVEKKRGTVVELVTSTPQPIVRLTTRSEAEARYRDMKRALKKGARVGEEPKEVQLTWGVGRADLEHKLRKAGRDLEKGYRVAVVITSKHKNRPPGRREWVAFADEISETLSEVGEEWKEREVTDRMITLSFRLNAKKAELDDDDVP